MKKILLVFLLLVPVVMAKSGSMKLLATTDVGEKQLGSIADVYLEVKPGNGRIFIDSFPLTKLDTVMSTRFANEIACDVIEMDCSKLDFFYTIRANSAIVGGPSAGASMAALTISVLEDIPLDKTIVMTGTINSGGLIGPVGGIEQKVDAAEKFNLSKVLIPKWGSLNDSEIDNLTSRHKIKVVQVSGLRDAMLELTGRKVGKDYSLIISSDYKDMMRNISGKICERTERLTIPNFSNESLLNDAAELLEKGREAQVVDQLYSSASYCFGANVKLKYVKFLRDNISEEEILSAISQGENRTHEYKDSIMRREIESFTDLQALMVVTERLNDAIGYFNASRESLLLNSTNSSIYNLAYGEERLYSAYSWASFFGTPGVKFRIDASKIRDACLNKVTEVEERLEYVKLYLPMPFDEIKNEIRESYGYYDKEDYSLCLYQASKAKAEVDIIMNTLGLSTEEIKPLVEERMKVAEQIIGRQMENSVFPIVGFSYYEYAKSLKDTDTFSAILYAEYAIELSKMDIYFKDEKPELPYVEPIYYALFALGFIWGFVVCFIWLRRNYIGSRKKK